MNLAARNFDGDRFGAGKNCRYYCRKMGGDNFGRGKLGKENVPSCSPSRFASSCARGNVELTV